MADEDSGCVIVLLAAALVALGLGLREFGLAGTVDQFLGTVRGQEVEQLLPVREVKAVDEAG
jgi:hypothetical protein